MVRDFVPVRDLGPTPMHRSLAFCLTNDASHTRRDEYSEIYHTRRETQCAAVRTNNTGPVHRKTVDGEGIYAGAGLVAGADSSACVPH